VHRGGKEGFFLHRVYKEKGKTMADVTIHAPTIPGGKWRKQVELQRRFMHPKHLFQNVAFIPS
jgi:hypothetical protein